MAYFTKNSFTSTAKTRSTKTFSASISEARNDYRSTKTTSIFLSHSHLDKDMIAAAVALFKGLPVSVYVDWADQTMPEYTNAITAAKIKQKIEDNKKFILLATNNAIASKWCNWELGIGDIKKLYNDRLAIIPLADNSGDWKGNEYIQMYPRIEHNDWYPNILKVIYPNDTAITLDQWLKR